MHNSLIPNKKDLDKRDKEEEENAKDAWLSSINSK